MYKVKTLNNISEVGLDVFDKTAYEVGAEVESPDAILVRSADMLGYEFNPELRCIARAGAGTNNIPLDRCSEAGIVVFNSPGANAEAVKELVLCALLIASRDVVGGIEWVKSIAGEGDAVAKLVEKGKSKFVGPEIMGKTLGVVGLGAVGAKVANAAVELGMKVMGYDPYLSVDAAWKLSSAIRHVTDLNDLFRSCDYITLHMPLTPETRGLVNAESLGMMKDGVRILNLARGELVDDDAILTALESGKAACYVTDFPNGKVAGKAGVIATPHIGASTPESEDNCAVMAVNEIMEYLTTGNIRNSVNMPSVSMEHTGGARITVINRNIPNMLGSMTSALSGCGINIENLTNKSRGDYAYTIIDIAEPAGQETLDTIAKVDGVLRVRQIVW